MTSGKKLKRGAQSAAPSLAGALVLGPTIGGPVGGIAADQMLDSNQADYTSAGLAVGLSGLLLGGAAAGSSSSRRGTK